MNNPETTYLAPAPKNEEEVLSEGGGTPPSSSPAPTQVILVHGTWGRESEFAQPTSEFCTAIKKGTGFENIEFTRCEWSGTNSTIARLAAADEITSLAAKLRKSKPGSRIFVIAHSHGGMAALYAIRQHPDLLDGLCCLSTPFLCPVERNWRLLLRWDADSIGTAVYLLWLLLCGVIAFLVTRSSTWGAPPPIGVGIALICAIPFCLFIVPYIVVRIVRLKLKRIKGDLSFVTWLEHFGSSKVAEGMSRLVLPTVVRNLKVISNAADEALISLITFLGAAHLPYFVFAVLLKIMPFAFAGVVITVLVAKILPDGVIDDVPVLIWLANGSAAIWIACLLCVYILVPAFIFVYYFHKLPFVVGRGTSLTDSAFVRLKPCKLPPMDHEYYAAKLRIKGLFNHSVAHSHPETINVVAEWLKRVSTQ
jgi:pimeloyl-ACP methyl ester carboxylesterase